MDGLLRTCHACAHHFGAVDDGPTADGEDGLAGLLVVFIDGLLDTTDGGVWHDARIDGVLDASVV